MVAVRCAQTPLSHTCCKSAAVEFTTRIGPSAGYSQRAVGGPKSPSCSTVQCTPEIEAIAFTIATRPCIAWPQRQLVVGARNQIMPTRGVEFRLKRRRVIEPVSVVVDPNFLEDGFLTHPHQCGVLRHG